jgi:hypothetical protein
MVATWVITLSVIASPELPGRGNLITNVEPAIVSLRAPAWRLLRLTSSASQGQKGSSAHILNEYTSLR